MIAIKTVDDIDNYVNQMRKLNKISEDNYVPYGSDMFYLAIDSIAKYQYAIAVDEEGKPVVILQNYSCRYLHRYRYTGGADMDFLDQYNCLILHDCNEFSVKLCQAVLHLWKGKRLVLAGKNWEKMIPLLPDLPAIECYYEENFRDDRYIELTTGYKALNIIYGIPHAEPMDRYKQGIMYYDEVMSFTFLFSDYRELGDKNEDKKFFVIDGYYAGLGLFAIFPKIEVIARYVKSKGFIPVVQLTMSEGSFYQDDSDDDIWKKFYEQPEQYTLQEVMQSRHVFFSPGIYNGSVQSEIMNRLAGDTILSWPQGIYNQKVQRYMQEKQKQFLPYPKETLGVLARGTDYIHTHLSNHPIHASIDMICEKIDWALKEWNLKYIYVATEDKEYCSYLQKRYGDNIYFTDQERYSVKENETISQMQARQLEKRNGYLLGVEYILAINLLAKCHSLIASGSCGGVDEAVKENAGKYKNLFVFDLGMNP